MEKNAFICEFCGKDAEFSVTEKVSGENKVSYICAECMDKKMEDVKEQAYAIIQNAFPIAAELNLSKIVSDVLDKEIEVKPVR